MSRELFWRNAKYMQLVLFQDTSSDSLRIEKSIVEETVKYMYIANILAVHHLSILNTVFFLLKMKFQLLQSIDQIFVSDGFLCIYPKTEYGLLKSFSPCL